jgi:hypothetical protein
MDDERYDFEMERREDVLNAVCAAQTRLDVPSFQRFLDLAREGGFIREGEAETFADPEARIKTPNALDWPDSIVKDWALRLLDDLGAPRVPSPP